MMYGQTWEEQQTWMKMHQGDPVLPIGPYHHYRPCGLYDRMLKKVAPFPVKGILWYQGESDEVHADLYALLMEKLIQCFRDAWMDEQLPFLYVQLAPFERWLECRGDRYPQVRACQELVSKKVATSLAAFSLVMLFISTSTPMVCFFISAIWMVVFSFMVWTSFRVCFPFR